MIRRLRLSAACMSGETVDLQLHPSPCRVAASAPGELGWRAPSPRRSEMTAPGAVADGPPLLSTVPPATRTVDSMPRPKQHLSQTAAHAVDSFERSTHAAPMAQVAFRGSRLAGYATSATSGPNPNGNSQASMRPRPLDGYVIALAQLGPEAMALVASPERAALAPKE